VIRALVSPLNQLNATLACQKLAHQSGLLRDVYFLIMSGGMPVDVLTEAITTAAELMRGCTLNQSSFDETSVPAPEEDQPQ